MVKRKLTGIKQVLNDKINNNEENTKDYSDFNFYFLIILQNRYHICLTNTNMRNMLKIVYLSWR